MKEWVFVSKWRDDKVFSIFFPKNVAIANFYVYVLFKSNKIVYIGSTKNYKARIKTHISDRKAIDCGFIIACDCKYDALFLEKDMIFCMMPEYHFPTLRERWADSINDRVKIWRDKNKKRWEYFLENKNKPSSESNMYISKTSVIFLNKDLISDTDIEKYLKLDKNED